MSKVTLVKKQNLGDGWAHVFMNDLTGKEEYFPCSQAEYESLAVGAGIKECQKKKGYTYRRSEGWKIKVDNPDEELHEGEYTDHNGGYIGKLRVPLMTPEGEKEFVIPVKFKAEEIVDHEFDMANLEIVKPRPNPTEEK